MRSLSRTSGAHLISFAFAVDACDTCECSAGQYLDPNSGKVFTFNHLTRSFGEETDKKQVLSESIEAVRAAIQKALEAYIVDLYKPNKATVAVYGADNGTITVCLSAKNVNLSNFWCVEIAERDGSRACVHGERLRPRADSRLLLSIPPCCCLQDWFLALCVHSVGGFWRLG